MSLLLGRALALSVMLHAYALAYLGTRLPLAAPSRVSSADLSVLLREERRPEPPPQPAPRVEPPDAKPAAPRPRARLEQKKRVEKKRTVEKKKPVEVRPPYPLEAVARGLEGDVMVRVVLDDNGNVIASRLEASSGHALLDDAAVQAARGLRGLPDGMPREALLPVRFRLR